MAETFAPGWPGIPARWTSSAKSGVGTALSGSSDLWFTISHGVVNEVYYPRIDHACTRDMGFIVTGPGGFLSEEKRDAVHEISCSAPGVPAYRLLNTCLNRHYRIEKELVTDPARPVLLQRSRFTALDGARGRLSTARSAGAAPRQSRQREHRVDRRAQGNADALRRARRNGAGARFVGAVVQSVGRIRRRRPTAGRTCTSTMR